MLRIHSWVDRSVRYFRRLKIRAKTDELCRLADSLDEPDLSELLGLAVDLWQDGGAKAAHGALVQLAKDRVGARLQGEAP